MARGQQKIQSQQKKLEKAQKNKKGGSLSEHKASAAKALIYSCSVCMSQIPDPKTYKQHFQNKHPKYDLPDELKDI